jgi:hypothetical protein
MLCGVSFLTSELKKTWFEAKKFCCEIGMNLVSIYSLEKQNCLYNLLVMRKIAIYFQGVIFVWKYLHFFPSKCAPIINFNFSMHFN